MREDRCAGLAQCGSGHLYIAGARQHKFSDLSSLISTLAFELSNPHRAVKCPRIVTNSHTATLIQTHRRCITIATPRHRHSSNYRSHNIDVHTTPLPARQRWTAVVQREMKFCSGYTTTSSYVSLHIIWREIVQLTCISTVLRHYVGYYISPLSPHVTRYEFTPSEVAINRASPTVRFHRPTNQFEQPNRQPDRITPLA